VHKPCLLTTRELGRTTRRPHLSRSTRRPSWPEGGCVDGGDDSGSCDAETMVEGAKVGTDGQPREAQHYALTSGILMQPGGALTPERAALCGSAGRASGIMDLMRRASVRITLIVLAVLCGAGAALVANWLTAAAMALLVVSQGLPLVTACRHSRRRRRSERHLEQHDDKPDRPSGRAA